MRIFKSGLNPDRTLKPFPGLSKLVEAAPAGGFINQFDAALMELLSQASFPTPPGYEVVAYMLLTDAPDNRDAAHGRIPNRDIDLFIWKTGSLEPDDIFSLGSIPFEEIFGLLESENSYDAAQVLLETVREGATKISKQPDCCYKRQDVVGLVIDQLLVPEG